MLSIVLAVLLTTYNSLQASAVPPAATTAVAAPSTASIPAQPSESATTAAAKTDIQPRFERISIILSWPHHGDPYSRPRYGSGYEDKLTKLYAYVRDIKEGNDFDYFACIPVAFMHNNPNIWNGKEAKTKYESLAAQFDLERKALAQQASAAKKALASKKK